MHWMNGRARLVTVALAVIAAVVVGGCSGGGAAGDKAGGAGEPVVLRMANAYGDLNNDIPAVQYFVSQVKRRSGGNVRVQVASPWGDYATDAEQQVVRAVAAGKADLGWSGARVFDTMGVTSFQALQAPMLIDSYALQRAVLASDMPGQMLQGLDKVGVRGLGVLADGLRKPIAVNHHAGRGGLARDHVWHPQVARPDPGDPGARRDPDGGLPTLAQPGAHGRQAAGVRDEPPPLRAQRPGAARPLRDR